MSERARAGLARALDDRDGLVAVWARRFSASPWRSGRVADHELAGLIRPVVDQLSTAVGGGGRLPGPGSQELREVERAAAFGGASLAATGVSGFDIAAALRALGETLAERVPDRHDEVLDLLQWVSIIALDSLATASRERERERTSEQLEQGIPVVLLTRDLPATHLIGSPSSEILDVVFGRLVLLVVRVGAPAVIVDVGGLVDPAAPQVIDSARRFLGHRKVADVEVLTVGFRSDTAEQAWKKLADEVAVTLRVCARFDDAVARALERSGCRLVRHGSA